MLTIAIAWGATGPAALLSQSTADPSEHAARLLALAPGSEVYEERVQAGGPEPLILRVILKPETAERASRLIAATKSALLSLGDWHGPFPGTALTVVDTRWDSGLAGASYPGVIAVTARLFEPAGDRSLERAVIAAVARQYWQVPPGADAERRWLGEGLALYAAVRAIHEGLEGRHFATARYFGGFVPYTSRAVLWSPSPTDPRPKIRHFPEVEQPVEAPWRAWTAASGGEAQRVALALHTLERYLGWPALQPALEAFQSRWQGGAAGPADLAATISEQRGTDMRWFFEQALRFDARFDYGIEAFSSEPSPVAPGEYETRVSVRRFGDGVFAGTAEPRGPLQAARSLKVLTRFEDGTAIEEWWDGRAAALEFVYAGPSRALSASVDPDAMLLLDGDRSNNTRVASAAIPLIGARFTASWLVWLQDVMLVSSALL